MALAEIEKLNLIAMSYDRDKLLNALQKTGATEIKLQNETEYSFVLQLDCETLRGELSRAETALGILAAQTERYNKEHKIKSDELKDGFAVTYSEFMAGGEKAAETQTLIDRITQLSSRGKQLETELVKLKRALEEAELFGSVSEPLNSFSDTAHTAVRLGFIPSAETERLSAFGETDELFAAEVLEQRAERALVLVTFYKTDAEADAFMQSLSFTGRPQKECSGAELVSSLRAQIADTEAQIAENAQSLYELHTQIKPLKIYCDYLSFELEKAELSEKMRATETTFLLEAYVPKDAEGAVSAAIEGVSGAAYFEFSAPAEDEMPPTLYKNNAVVKNFEAITNMYSPASSREIDPNTVMAFFYSIFLGFIMADIGYGLFMLLGGGIIWFKKRKSDSGFKRLAGVFAVGGIFALIWGILFNSLFGIPLEFMPTVMPDAQKDMWSFMGIKIPAVLIISMEIGIVQLLVGYLMRAVQCMRRGQFLDGMLDGFVWVVFSLGAGLAIIGLVEEANVSVLAIVGGIMAGASLAIAILTAGRKEKLLGKFTKGFGAAYGIINYASDVLSYARLYGLMLSGAVIAQIISGYAVTGMNGGVGFLMSGSPAFIILGVVLLIVGHAFNLAIGLLGAYIHDARLQYVEFYGRFFEGEGELFTPLGSKHKYVTVQNEKLPQAQCGKN